MTIPFPFPVYGTVKSYTGLVVVGATVEVVDVTNNQGICSGVTIAGGKYVIDIHACATDGDTIKVSCTHQGVYDEETFNLDVGDLGKVIDLILPLSTPGLSPGAMLTVMKYVAGYC